MLPPRGRCVNSHSCPPKSQRPSENSVICLCFDRLWVTPGVGPATWRAASPSHPSASPLPQLPRQATPAPRLLRPGASPGSGRRQPPSAPPRLRGTPGERQGSLQPGRAARRLQLLRPGCRRVRVGVSGPWSAKDQKEYCNSRSLKTIGFLFRRHRRRRRRRQLKILMFFTLISNHPLLFLSIFQGKELQCHHKRDSFQCCTYFFPDCSFKCSFFLMRNLPDCCLWCFQCPESRPAIKVSDGSRTLSSRPAQGVAASLAPPTMATLRGPPRSFLSLTGLRTA